MSKSSIHIDREGKQCRVVIDGENIYDHLITLGFAASAIATLMRKVEGGTDREIRREIVDFVSDTVKKGLAGKLRSVEVPR